jgi:hypothetical protein
MIRPCRYERITADSSPTLFRPALLPGAKDRQRSELPTIQKEHSQTVRRGALLSVFSEVVAQELGSFMRQRRLAGGNRGCGDGAAVVHDVNRIARGCPVSKPGSLRRDQSGSHSGFVLGLLTRLVFGQGGVLILLAIRLSVLPKCICERLFKVSFCRCQFPIRTLILLRAACGLTAVDLLCRRPRNDKAIGQDQQSRYQPSAFHDAYIFQQAPDLGQIGIAGVSPSTRTLLENEGEHEGARSAVKAVIDQFDFLNCPRQAA